MTNGIYNLLDQLNNDIGKILVVGDLKMYVDKITTKATILAVHQQSLLKGFIAYYDNDENKKNAFLTMLAVHMDCRNRGYGKALLEFSIANLKRAGFETYSLQVREENIGAKQLYESMGFIVKGKSHANYSMALAL